MSDYFQKWYKDNKGALSERRKKRYREDPEYREKVLARNRAKKTSVTVPPNFISLVSAAESLGITPFVLRYWCQKEYYPAPTRLGNRDYLTRHQLSLLEPLRDFLQEKTRDATRLDNIVALIYSNWT